MKALCRLVSPLAQIATWVATLALNAAFFAPVERLMPARLRMNSVAFVATALTYVAAAIARHLMTAGTPAELVGQGLLLAILMALACLKRTPEVTLCLAASAGIDLFICGVGLTGTEVGSNAVCEALPVWLCMASLFCVAQFHVSRHRVEQDSDV